MWYAKVAKMGNLKASCKSLGFLQTETELHARGSFSLFYTKMKDYAKTFYKSKAWQACRNSYMQQAGGLCEECLARGIYTPAEIVHHRTPITPENIMDPMIALSWQNLKAVCRECHLVEHGARAKRYKLDPDGRVVAVK